MRKIFLNHALGLLLVATFLTAAKVPAALPPMPLVSLPSGLSGESAISALGTNFAAVAAHYGKTTAQLLKLLQTDATAHLDAKGNLYFVCAPSGLPQNVTRVAVPALYPLTNTFFLHSKPGSTKVIYLDVGGYTITGTQWNTDFNNGSDIICPPWDTDGNSAVFGTNELTDIQQIWARVAEDFAPFDVDVTTQYPGEAAITRANLADVLFGMRVIISPIGSFFPAQAAGIAYLQVFDEVGDFHKPAIVMSDRMLDNPRYIAEGSSHEVGHTLSLQHQGTSFVGYYDGHANWGPIMGTAGYYRPIVQWARGEYFDANNQEDELTLITSTGLNYRSSDFGNSFGTATYLPGNNSTTNGIISRTAETDMFYVQSGTGNVRIAITNWAVSSDLHAILTVYDESQNIITNLDSIDDNAGTHGINFTLPVVAGKYYVAVTGRGAGNPLNTGYSAYASLGQYTLTITNPLSQTTGSQVPVTAPRSPWGTALSVMNGSNPNGNWYLFVQDDKQIDIGAINSGWILNLTSANPVGFAADNQMYSSPSLANVNLNSTWTVTLCVTNYGPSASTNIVVNDFMPIRPGLSYISSAASIGSIMQFGSNLVWSVGNLATNTGATMSVSFAASGIGLYTNNASVSSTTTDPNPDDDQTIAVANVAVFSPPTISAVTIAGGQPTISITNVGGAISMTIQATTNLVAPIIWQSLYTTNTAAFTFTDLNATNYPIRFYRAILAP